MNEPEFYSQQETSLAVAWSRAFLTMSQSPERELSPFLVSISADADGQPIENEDLREAFAQLTRGVVRLVQQAPNRNGRPYWGSYDNGAGQQDLGMVRAIIGKSNNQQIGNLVLVIRPEHFSAIFDDVAVGSGTEIYVLDASNDKLIVGADGTSATIDRKAEPGLIEKIANTVSLVISAACSIVAEAGTARNSLSISFCRTSIVLKKSALPLICTSRAVISQHPGLISCCVTTNVPPSSR